MFLLPSNKLRGEGKKARANKRAGKTFNRAAVLVILKSSQLHPHSILASVRLMRTSFLPLSKSKGGKKRTFANQRRNWIKHGNFSMAPQCLDFCVYEAKTAFT